MLHSMLVAFPALVAPVQTCPEVVDVNTQTIYSNAAPMPGDSSQRDFVELGGTWFFTADTPSTGRELFGTDGTAAGTFLVKDIRPGVQDSDIGALTRVGSQLWFRANDGVHGTELWTSDGTAAGTHLVKNIFPGLSASAPQAFARAGAKAVFIANNGSAGYELWASDGTEAGTQLVFDIFPGLASSANGQELHTGFMGQRAFLFANDGTSGTEPWVTDGTAAGTHLLLDINPGVAGSFAPSSSSGFLTWNGKTYFVANDGVHGAELWASDGTTAGTAMVADANPTGDFYPQLSFAVEYNGELYFAANGAGGTELYRTDGTSITLAFDLNPSGSSSPRYLNVVNNRIVFFAEGSAATGVEPYATDGTLAGTVLLADGYPGSTDSFTFDPYAGLAAATSTHVYFQGRHPATGVELFRTDGTPAGTQLVADIATGSTSSIPTYITPIAGDRVLFSAGTFELMTQLFVSDGTSAGTHLVTPLQFPPETESSNPRDLHAVGTDYVLFAATQPGVGEEVFRWDPVGGAQLVLDIFPGTGTSQPREFTNVHFEGKLQTAFRAVQPGKTGLFITDGTAAGTHEWVALPPATSGSSPHGLTYQPQHERLYFGYNSFGGGGLWSTDGTNIGTRLESPGLLFKSEFSYTPDMLAIGDKLFVAGSRSATGFELYVTDGSVGGLQLVADIVPGTGSGDPTHFVRVGDRLAFIANNPSTGREAYLTDGTAAGTVRLTDLAIGPDEEVLELYEHAGKLLMLVRTDAHGKELWATDLVAGTAQRLTDDNSTLNNAGPSDVVSAGAHAFFNTSTWPSVPFSTGEPWKTDGTPAGTQLITTITPALSTEPSLFLPAGEGTAFVGRSSADGFVIYLTDGTAAGTVPTCGTPSTAPFMTSFEEAIVLGDKLVYIGTSQWQGAELVVLDAPRALSQDLGLGASSATLQVSPPVLGGAALVEVEGAPAGLVHVLAYSAPATVNTVLTAPGSLGWLDLGSVVLAKVFTTPSLSQATPIPADPALAGAKLHAQVWHLGAPFPAETSNGVALTLGN